MGESTKHIELVAMVQREVAAMVTDRYASLIQVDSPDSTEKARIGRHCPDVYYNYDGKLVVGEAKTLDDFARKHSQEQFDEYLAACSTCLGESALIVAVPWMLAATAKNFFRRRTSLRGKTRIIILDDTKGRWEL